MNRKQISSANRRLQREQLGILKVQKYLLELEKELAEAANALKVEELQLKASWVASLKTQPSERQGNPDAQPDVAVKVQPFDLLDSTQFKEPNVDELNKQDLSLDVSMPKYEEEDSD